MPLGALLCTEGRAGALGAEYRGTDCPKLRAGALYCGVAGRGALYSGAVLALPEAGGMGRGATYSVRS